VTMHKLLALLAPLVLAAPLPAQAESVRAVAGAVVHLGDLVDAAPAEAAEVPICAAPPPGSSKLVTRDEVRRKLREAGVASEGVKLPRVVRVASTAERWSADKISEQALSALGAALPAGVTLAQARAVRGAVVRPGTSLKAPKLEVPRRPGRHQIASVAELVQGETVLARVPLAVIIEVAEDAFVPAVPRGQRVTVFIEQGPARVGASAIALTDADVGAEALFRVTSTGRVLKARVESRELARVVGP
jgi:flagella basal body P-ring formation protein FlgA